MRAPITALLMLLAAPAFAQAPAGDADAGHEIARRWCANCHAVERQPTRAGDAVPSFASIAARHATTARSLRLFLQNPHGNMPNFQLAGRQIDDAAAYILSLRRR